jgi:hypothetical protein
MKKNVAVTLIAGLVIAAVLALYLPSGVHAQQAQPATPVQQTATHVDTCTPLNGTAAAAAQATLTIAAPPSSQFVYISEIDIEMANSAAITTGQIDTVTSTNLGSPSIQWNLVSTTAIGTESTLAINYAPGALKSAAPATKVTIVGPTGVTGLTQNINACYYYGY